MTTDFYGAIPQNVLQSDLDGNLEELSILGFTVLNKVIREPELQTLRAELAALWTTQSQEAGRYLSASIARLIAAPDAESLAQGLDTARLDKWVAALAAEKQPFEEPFEPLRAVFCVSRTRS